MKIENIYPNQFNGYCPESWLKNGETVRMKLNKDDFFESEATGLQIALSYPRVQATILNWRGKGNFKNTISYADEFDGGEFLFEQTKPSYPFCDDKMIENNEHLLSYIETIK